jgi:hypothetical protein
MRTDPTQLQAFLKEKVEAVQAELEQSGRQLSNEELLRLTRELMECADGLKEWSAATMAAKAVNKARSAR